MLWIYAENDKSFPPEMAKMFKTSFEERGGTTEFILAPLDGDDGHDFFRHVAAWGPIVDAYLKKLNLLPLVEPLPLPQAHDVPIPAGLDDSGRAAFLSYLTSGPFKAFAMDGEGHFGRSGAAFSQELANRSALAGCRKNNPKWNAQILLLPSARCAIVSQTPDQQ
jgi:hypothetical protein